MGLFYLENQQLTVLRKLKSVLSLMTY